MSNIGGPEIVMVLVIALIVLGPTKLPEAARQVGKVVTEIRRVSSGFQREFREAIQDPIIEAEARARGAVGGATKAITEPFLTDSARPGPPSPPVDDAGPDDA